MESPCTGTYVCRGIASRNESSAEYTATRLILFDLVVEAVLVCLVVNNQTGPAAEVPVASERPRDRLDAAGS